MKKNITYALLIISSIASSQTIIPLESYNGQREPYAY